MGKEVPIMKKLFMFICCLLVFLIFPNTLFAVDYEINETNIHAMLQPDGQVEVHETHTYTFEGEFSGITRTLIPKEDSTISNVRASEAGVKLTVEQEDELYRIHRQGTDETVTIDIFYTIDGGVDVYEDVAQFYWPFFDKSNESTYENLTITIEPPMSGEVEAAYGYDEAYGTAQIHEDGVVIFALGEVPDETNGDIRVAYDCDMFPEANVTSEEPMLDTILAEKEALDNEVAAYAENKERWSNYAPWLVGGMALLAIVLIAYGLWKRRETMHEAIRQEKGTGHFPKVRMSLPAMLLFMNHAQLPVSALTAALLDLVRKGNIEKESDDVLRLVHLETDYKHERYLLDWMFGKIGRNNTLHMEDIEAYTKEKKNQEEYYNNYHHWQSEVKQEYKKQELYVESTAPRWIAGLVVLITLPIAIFFAYYGIVVWAIMAFVMTFFFVVFALSYRPLTIHGHQLKKKLGSLTLGDQWKRWDKEDSVPAFLYQMGMGKRDLLKEPIRTADSQDLMIFLLLGSMLHPTLQEADRQASASAAAAGTSSGGGGAGVGGGGGGSGAF
mgnify:FL=1